MFRSLFNRIRQRPAQYAAIPVVAAGVVGPRAQKVAAVALNLERLQSQDNRMRVATRVQRR